MAAEREAGLLAKAGGSGSNQHKKSNPLVTEAPTSSTQLELMRAKSVVHFAFHDGGKSETYFAFEGLLNPAAS